MDKSHVSIGQLLCICTGQLFDSGEILLDKRLEKSLEHKTTTGWGISPEPQEHIDKGFVVLVGIDPEKSEVVDDGIAPEGAHRTGDIAYMKKEAFMMMFNLDVCKDVNFVEDGVIEHLKTLA